MSHLEAIIDSITSMLSYVFICAIIVYGFLHCNMTQREADLRKLEIESRCSGKRVLI